MASLNGTEFGVFLGTSNTLIGYSTSCSLTVSKEPRNTTNSTSNGWNTRMDGSKDWEVSCDALLAMSGTTNMWYQIYSNYLDTGSPIFRLQFKTTGSGDRYFKGPASITGLTLTASMEETATCSVSFVAAGPLELLTNP